MGNSNTVMSPLDEDDSKNRFGTCGIVAGLILVCLLFVAGLVVLGLAPGLQNPLSALNSSPLLAPWMASPTATLTGTPTSTPTSTPSPTPNATATQYAMNALSTASAAQSTATQAAKWTTIFSETFDKNSHGWLTGPSDDDYAKMDFEVQDGVYRVDATAHKGFAQRLPINTRSLTDFFLSADVSQVSGTARSQGGLVFRQDTQGNYYLFAISNNPAQYSLDKYVDGQWSQIINWSPATALVPGKPNRMAVLAEGDTFLLFINDQFVAEAQDSTLKKGITGLAMGIYEADLQAAFEFDNVVVRAPK